MHENTIKHSLKCFTSSTRRKHHKTLTAAMNGAGIAAIGAAIGTAIANCSEFNTPDFDCGVCRVSCPKLNPHSAMVRPLDKF